AATSTRETALLKEPLAAAEPAPALGVLSERLPEVAAVEVWPELVDEHELGVGELPEHEVRHAQLPARPDQQVGIGELGRVEVRRKHVLVDLARVGPALRDPPRRLDELGAAAVVERDPEAQPDVQLGAVLHRLHPRAKRRGGAVAPADEAHADAL